MKLLMAVLIVSLCGAASAMAQWKKGDEPVPDTPDRKSVRGFGGHLLIVADPRKFIEDWQKPEMPHIPKVDETKRGELLGAVVLFAGCTTDAQGKCNAEVDYAIYKPDGKLLAEHKNQPLWKEAAPPAPNIQLSRAILGIRLEDKDPLGEYTVKATVSDLNARVSFELETKFSLK
jgi:hypothetical protein